MKVRNSCKYSRILFFFLSQLRFKMTPISFPIIFAFPLIFLNYCLALPQGQGSTSTAASSPAALSALPCSLNDNCVPSVTNIQGPLLQDVLADPSIVKDGDDYYAYATQQDKDSESTCPSLYLKTVSVVIGRPEMGMRCCETRLVWESGLLDQMGTLVSGIQMLAGW